MEITDPFGLVFAALGLFVFFGLGLTRSLLPMSMWKKANAEIDEVKAQEKTRSVYYYVRFRDDHGIEHRVMTLTYGESYRFPQLNPGDPVSIRYATSLLGKKTAIIDEEGFLAGNQEQLSPVMTLVIMGFALVMTFIGLYLSGLLG